VAIVGLGLAYVKLGLHWSLGLWLFVPLVVISGTVIEMTLNLMVACISFWTGRSSIALDMIMEFNILVQHYPIDIFSSWFRIVVTGLIPVAFMNYYPALLLLGKIDQTSVPWLGYISPIVALLLVGLTSIVWRSAMHRYSSSRG